nr:unnamed protein product [Digitaria exilis]
MRPAFSATRPSPSGREKGRRKGGGADQLLTDQVLSLRSRLHDALALGLAKERTKIKLLERNEKQFSIFFKKKSSNVYVRSDGHGTKKWQSTDAGIQSHVLKAAVPFVGCLSNELLKLAPIKESISDILVALEGILKTKNVSVLIQAADVSLKLVSSIGNSIRQYPTEEMASLLSSQLSAEQPRIAVPCAAALTCILNSLVPARTSAQADIWVAHAVASAISAIQKYNCDVHPLNYLTEMISLLRSILWIWPSSRYPVWSNRNLMAKLTRYCLSAEITVAAKILKLYAALALCGDGALVLLSSEELIAKIGVLMGKSHPTFARIEALKLCQVLLSLQEMLQKEQPRWNSNCPKYDLTAAVESAQDSSSDIILESQSKDKMDCLRSSCELSTPHVHGHKIVLIMNSDYLRALFRSGMHESFSEAIKVPVGWQALDKLVKWFYSGELPRIAPDCRWKNMSSEEQLSHLKAYAELSSLAEFWFLEGVKEESLDVVASCLNSSTNASVEFISFAANLGQWELVEATIGSVAHLYPRLRDSGQLERLDEDVLNMLRTEYVRYSQHRGGRN